MFRGILFSIALLAAGVALAQSSPTASLSWTAVTTDSNGNALTGITYNVYQGAQGAALVKVQSGIATAADSVTAGLTPGSTQCFAVTAVANGVEGAQSTTACAAIPFPTPGTPSQITVVIH